MYDAQSFILATIEAATDSWFSPKLFVGFTSRASVCTIIMHIYHTTRLALTRSHATYTFALE
mgnify:FL=1